MDKIDQLGRQANTGGALLADGAWCCPAIPELLVTATIDHRSQHIDDQLHADLITARAAYRLHPKDGPDADGYTRRRTVASRPVTSWSMVANSLYPSAKSDRTKPWLRCRRRPRRRCRRHG